MLSRDLDYVVDILAAAHLIQTFLTGRDWNAFELIGGRPHPS
jgi:hypothetical protein